MDTPGPIESLIKRGESVLIRATPERSRDHIPGELAAAMYAVHTLGRFLLRGIDRATYRDYCALFGRTQDHTMGWLDWNNYLISEMQKCLGILFAVRDSPQDALDLAPAKIFISHGKFGPAFERLVAFVHALGCVPLYDADEPSEGRTINAHVQNLFDQADFFVILMTIETTNERNQQLPNHNVVIEFDRLVRSDSHRMIVLTEEGCKPPSLVQDVIYEGFRANCMDSVFMKLAAALTRLGLL
jgi:predicted nucleotide-binding protein